MYILICLFVFLVFRSNSNGHVSAVLAAEFFSSLSKDYKDTVGIIDELERKRSAELGRPVTSAREKNSESRKKPSPGRGY
jgi:hypothetical protein